MKIDKMLRPSVLDLKPYTVEDIPHKIKMDANENPYDIPFSIKSEIAEEIFRLKFNRYPDPYARELREALANDLNVKINQVIVGNGSDELINYIISAFGGQDATVIYPTPTFSIYGITAKLLETKIVEVPLSDSFDILSDKVISAMKASKRSIVFIAYPNNPTGNCFSTPAMMDIIDKSESSIIVFDEAYYEFCRRTFIELCKERKNIIVLRTFSKACSLAGIRVGYMVASEEVINEIMKVKLVFNLNSLSQRIALIALKHKGEMMKYIDKILEERDRLANELSKISYVRPFKSDANFILFRVKDVEMVSQNLLGKGILVRNFKGNEILKDCLRVTIGKPEENNAFISALSQLSV